MLDRRSPLLLFTSLALAGSILAGTANAPALAAHRPNIVLIMTDDQTFEQMRVLTKTKQLIGDAGATFGHFFDSFPLCCPSRTTFMTGQYAHNHGVLDNTLPTGGFYRFDALDALPVWLQKAGYHTAHVGKFLNSYGLYTPKLIPPGWNDWEATVDPSTYQYYGYTINDNGRLVHYGNAAGDYQTDVEAARSVAAIHRCAAGDRSAPFYLNTWFLSPHREVDPITGAQAPPRCAPRHAGSFADAQLPADPSFDEADMSDKPLFMRVKPRLDAAARATILAQYRAELCALLAVDDAVAAIVGELADDGLLNDTYVFFVSDNGYFHGEHRTPDEKILGYEVSIHVPFLVRGPGIAPGTRIDELSANVDFAPTVVSLAHARPGLVMDGRSLIPYWRDPARRTTRPILIEAAFPIGSTLGFFVQQLPVPVPIPLAASNPIAEGDAAPQSPLPLGKAILPYQGVRTDRYVYIEYVTGERELYDLQKDPYQLSSVHLDPAYLKVEARLAVTLALLRACVGPLCRIQTGPLPEPG
jgi:arylsulfatase A-like enzyme